MTPRRTMNPVASFILACTLAVLFTVAIIHWMATCWDAGPYGMCTLLATQHTRWPWLGRLWASVRAACLRKELEWQESALDNMLEAEAELPQDIRNQRRRLDTLRVDLAVAEATARGDA